MNSKTLDLHGMGHSFVFKSVDDFVGYHIQNRTREIEIITGFSKEMKKIVNDVLEDYGASSKEQFGNAGKLIVDLT